MPHDRRDDRRLQPSRVFGAPHLRALPVPHDQQDRTRVAQARGKITPAGIMVVMSKSHSRRFAVVPSQPVGLLSHVSLAVVWLVSPGIAGGDNDDVSCRHTMLCCRNSVSNTDAGKFYRDKSRSPAIWFENLARTCLTRDCIRPAVCRQGLMRQDRQDTTAGDPTVPSQAM